MTPHQFATKWTSSTLKERSGAQEHFIDLCHLLGERTPADADPDGEWYCFERGAAKTGGGKGWADVWRKGCFAWEYKGKHKDLGVALSQLQRYALALENPPLLVVSDMEAIEIHTNFTNTVHETHRIPITSIGSDSNLRLLKCLFSDPDQLKPGRTKAAVTEEAAQRFGALAQALRDRGGNPQRVAHFLNRVLFCLFAQDAKLLPSNIVFQLLEAGVAHPDHANNMLSGLFAVMKKGGYFGAHIIEWFNGSLFDSSESIQLEPADIRSLLSVASLNWSAIEPSIFGTLFERGLDPEKRAQIGAHYTDSQSIMRIVQPTVIAPIERKWADVKRDITTSLARADKLRDLAASSKARQKAQQCFNEFLRKLAEFRVLDPACGSGNFLYLTLQALKDIEHRAALEAEQLGLEVPLTGMHVGVECLRGIEVNAFAAELARVTVWIGEIQWMLRHGMQPSKRPILKSLETIECRDAILAANGQEPDWPNADVIVGNPPFLGDKKMLTELGDHYTRRLRKAFKGRVPGGADLCCYWFEKARAAIASGGTSACGLVATNSIRGGKNRIVLDRICESAKIISAWKDEAWVNEGASVRVSLVSFGRKDNGSPCALDEHPIEEIFSDLTGHSKLSKSSDVTRARAVPENAGICFEGIKKYGAFDIPGETAREWLRVAGNPNGRPNSDVLRPWLNAMDIVRRPSDTWVIDFGSMSVEEASCYEGPFSHVSRVVRPDRVQDRNIRTRKFWWHFERPRADLRRRLQGLKRYIATPVVAKHRIFVWLPVTSLPSNLLDAIARDDDATFGILHSRFHELWALRLCTWLGVGNDPRYTPTTTFESFPFPEGFAGNIASSTLMADSRAQAIGVAAKNLNDLRENWLNPPELTKRVAEVVVGYSARIVARTGCETELKKRTLTNLYNVRPEWLANAHGQLDGAVAHAYGWNDYAPDMSDDEIVNRLLELNREKTPELFGKLPGRAAALVEVPHRPRKISNTESLRAEISEATLERRLAVICTLANRLADDRHFGRTKMAKLFYLVDATQHLELDTSYQRQAAGPLDPKALYDAETGLEALAIRHEYLGVDRSGRKITYRRGTKLGEAMQRARVVLGRNRTAINRLVDRFRKMDTDQCEIVATLYACWNDNIIDQKDTSDETIAGEFLGAWHEKKRRFTRERLLKALRWMKANDLVPEGKASHTVRRR